MSLDTLIKKPFNFVKRKTCPVCKSSKAETLFEQSFESVKVKKFIQSYYSAQLSEKISGNYYSLSRCSQCTLIYQSEILDTQGLNYLYEIAIDKTASLAKREQANSQYFQSLVQDSYAPIGFFPEKKPREIRVLDFGMGWGHWAIAAQAHGLDVVGAELSQSRIEFAKSKGIEVIDIMNSQLDDFDYINTDQVFEHLDDPHDVLEQLVNRLKPGGIIKIFVPNSTIDRLKLKYGSWEPCKDSFHPLEHINSFTNRSINIFTEQFSLKPISFAELKVAQKLKIRRVIARKVFGAPSWYFRK